MQKPWIAINKLIKMIRKNIFAKGFFFNRAKKIFFDLKSWGPLKDFKTRSVSYSGLAYPYMSNNKIKISLDCPLNCS
jgi:hypothetical protein